jgi:uncharacterized NAD(P)/FAD-binding protein YdhS
MAARQVRVLVVGGGAAGVIAAAALLRHGSAPVDVRIVERADTVGPGLAYRTPEPVHLLNNYAGRMSALEDDPGDLVRWCLGQGLAVSPETFLPRHVYGRYLAGLLRRVDGQPGSRVTRLRGEVVSLEEGAAGYVARLASGGRMVADVVVFALGNPPPRDMPGYGALGASYAADPWVPGLVDRVGPGSRVLLVGTGLTAVDVAAQLAGAHHDVEMVAVSRHAMLPRRHRPAAPRAAAPFRASPVDLAGVLAEVRHRGARLEEEGVDWRTLVESVKAVANDLWAGLPPRERDRFVRHVARHWEVVRHRMAPQVAEVVEGLLLDGRLRVMTPASVGDSGFDLVVNCTGPAPTWNPGWNPLVDDLAVRGLLRPDPLRLGLDVSSDGRLVGRDGRPARGIHVLGAARRGAEWEVAAVPDLRRQAVALAAQVAGFVPAPMSPSAPVRELVAR